jgi:hypothetical protein
MGVIGPSRVMWVGVRLECRLDDMKVDGFGWTLEAGGWILLGGAKDCSASCGTYSLRIEAPSQFFTGIIGSIASSALEIAVHFRQLMGMCTTIQSYSSNDFLTQPLVRAKDCSAADTETLW